MNGKVAMILIVFCLLLSLGWFCLSEITMAQTRANAIHPFIPKGAIVMWSGPLSALPKGWALCDGNNNTPNLLARFVLSIPNGSTNPGATGGALTHTHTGGSFEADSHSHSYFGTVDNATDYENVMAGAMEQVADRHHTHTYSGNTNPSGILPVTGTSGSAMHHPPFYELAFIMKL